MAIGCLETHSALWRHYWMTSRRTPTKLDRFIAKRKSRWPCDAWVIHARFARDEIINLASRGINRWVLQTAWYQYKQQCKESFDGPDDKLYRHIAYRQLTRWSWGILGKEIRVVLPSCAVMCIRNFYPPPGPEEEFVFTGFKYADEWHDLKLTSGCQCKWETVSHLWCIIYSYKEGIRNDLLTFCELNF